jgi:hypothetical protein
MADGGIMGRRKEGMERGRGRARKGTGKGKVGKGRQKAREGFGGQVCSFVTTHSNKN